MTATNTRRTKYLGNGTITIQDIGGNVNADKQADYGTHAHHVDPASYADIDDRAALTQAIQQHLVASWVTWIEHTKGKAKQGLDEVTANTNDQSENRLDDHLDELQQDHADACDQEMDDFFSEEFEREQATNNDEFAGTTPNTGTNPLTFNGRSKPPAASIWPLTA